MFNLSKICWVLFLAVMVLITFATDARATTCLPGPKEDTLSLGRIMRNMGRGFLPAESAALKGVQNPQSVSYDEVMKAISGLVMVRSCLEEAKKFSENQALLPNRAYFMKNESDRADFMKVYLARMEVFGQQVNELREMFELLVSTQGLRLPSTNPFTAIQEKIKLANEHINQSHSKMSCFHTVSKALQ